MKIRQVMSHPAVTVEAGAPSTEAAQLLIANGFTALPVVDSDGRLIGIVTEADLLSHSLAGAGARQRHHGPGTVESVMTSPVESLTPGCLTSDAARMMVDERIRCLPVVDGIRVVGVVTRRDLLRAGLKGDDARIADEVQQALEAFAGSDRWSIGVRAGVVAIEDYRDIAEDRAVARRLASTVPGVVSVTVEHQTFDPS